MSSDSSREAPVALITGASRGLGAALARFLSHESYRLVLNSRGAEALRTFAAELSRPDSEIRVVPGDVREMSTQGALRSAVRSFGRLDLLVNNASSLGPTPLPPLAESSPQAFEDVLAVNLLAPLRLIQTFLPDLTSSRGLVVNISSDAAVAGYPGWGIYGSSKAALDLVSLTLAHELESSGVSVVSVDPGDMRTAMHQAAYAGEDISDRPLPEVTLPFWAWLLNQDPARTTGHRFRAQSDRWEVLEG